MRDPSGHWEHRQNHDRGSRIGCIVALGPDPRNVDAPGAIQALAHRGRQEAALELPGPHLPQGPRQDPDPIRKRVGIRKQNTHFAPNPADTTCAFGKTLECRLTGQAPDHQATFASQLDEQIEQRGRFH